MKFKNFKFIREGIWGEAPADIPMDREDYKSHINQLDPEIKSLILELNRKGFQTFNSCAGHEGSYELEFRGSWPAGMIEFSKPIPPKGSRRFLKLRDILANGGIEEFEVDPPTLIIFKSLAD
jgi:hypothetical protein